MFPARDVHEPVRDHAATLPAERGNHQRHGSLRCGHRPAPVTG
jgi:hypothetical protein